MSDERILWKGTSSQMLNLHIYILCALLCVLIVPIFYALWRWIELRSREYEVTTERIRIRSGIFNKRTEELELYRANDMTLLEPFWQRLVGLGTLELTSHDATTPLLRVAGVPHAQSLREELRQSIEACRERKRVRLTELE